MKKKIVKVTAIILLIGLLFSMASLVSAGFVEEILNKELEISRGSSSYKQCNNHLMLGLDEYVDCGYHNCKGKRRKQFCVNYGCDYENYAPCPYQASHGT